VADWRQFAGLIGAPLAWMVQVMSIFLLADFGCGVVPCIRVWTIMGGVLSLVLCVVCGWIAWTAWKRTREEAKGRKTEAIQTGEGRSRFFAMTGLLAAGIFTTASLFTLLAGLMVTSC